MNQHFVEILPAFRDEGVEHLVIGAHALDDMRTAKRAAGRLKDLADLEELG